MRYPTNFLLTRHFVYRFCKLCTLNSSTKKTLKMFQNSLTGVPCTRLTGMPSGIRSSEGDRLTTPQASQQARGGVSVHINRVYVNICFGLCMPKPNRTPYTPAASQNKPPKWGFCRLFIPYLYPIKQERLIIKRLTAILSTQSRDRTGMEVNPLVFETSASTNSAIWAYLRCKVKTFFRQCKELSAQICVICSKNLI